MSEGLSAMPGVPTNFSQVIQDNVEESLSGVKGEIAIKIFGSDLNILQEKADHVAGIIAGIKGAVEVAAIQAGGQTEISVIPDRQKMARLGITIAELNRTFETAMGGRSHGFLRWRSALRRHRPHVAEQSHVDQRYC